jgi:methionine aminotransferase
MRAGHNQYAPMAGVPELRAAIADKIRESYGIERDPATEITVTSGATEALFAAIGAVVRPGDEVIVFDPAFDSYEPAIELNGGTAVHLPMMPPGFTIDWDRVAEAVWPCTRMIIVNSPHNPTGSVLGARDMARLEALVRDRDVFVLSDEVYEHIVFDDIEHQSILRYPSLAERAFAIFSFGKTFHVTGWKIGYCIAPPALTAEFRKVHQYLTFTTVTPMQHALADFLRQCPEHYRELPAFYQAKRDLFCRLLEGSRFHFSPSRGTYFQLVDYSAITDFSDVEYARRLTRQVKVASIPISVFSQEPPASHILRFCFAKDDVTLERAGEIVRAFYRIRFLRLHL